MEIRQQVTSFKDSEMRCVIHIGTEKTGTTSIQNALEKNTDSLLEFNTIYPSVFNSRNHPKISCYAMDFKKNNIRFKRYGINNQEKLDAFRTQFRSDFYKDIKKPIETVFIVNEHLYLLRNKKEVERLRDFLLPFFDEIKIVVYLRRQDRMALSMYSTRVKFGTTRKNVYPTWEEAKGRELVTLDYRRLLDLWSSVWGKENLTIRIFERDKLLDGDVVQDFLSISNMGLPAGSEVMNESLPPKALYAIRELNQYIPRNQRGDLGGLASALFSGKGALVTLSEAHEFLSYFESDNDSVAKNYLGTDKLFKPIGEGEYPISIDESSLGISVSEMAEVFAKLWVAKEKRHKHAKKVVAVLKELSPKKS